MHYNCHPYYLLRLLLGARRRLHLAVVYLYRPRRHLLQRLADDAQRLPHLLDAHQIAVVAIAVAPDRHVEIDLVVDVVGLRPAQIPSHPRAAQHWPGEPPIGGLLGADDADIDGALLEDAVIGQQPLDVVDRLREGVAERQDVVEETGWMVHVHGGWPELIGM